MFLEKMVKDGQFWSKMVNSGQKWSKMVKDGQYGQKDSHFQISCEWPVLEN
jgi:hypothetical protein